VSFDVVVDVVVDVDVILDGDGDVDVAVDESVASGPARRRLPCITAEVAAAARQRRS
jgi:hypothetical protein